MLARHLSALLVTAVMAAGCAQAEDEGAESTRDAVVGGAEADAAPAIGYVARGGINVGGVLFLDPFCTGTLIAPRIVLTAAHCAEAEERINGYVYFGIGSVREKRAVRSTQPMVPHPLYAAVDEQRAWKHDIAYIVLDAPITDVAPAKVRRSAHRGHCDYVSTGYGVHRTGYVWGSPIASEDAGERRATASCADAGFTAGPIHLPVDDDSHKLPGGLIHAYSNGAGAVCVGDSGGPLRISGTTEIVGVLSQIVDPVCTPHNKALYAPIDGNLDFVDQALEAGRRLDR